MFLPIRANFPFPKRSTSFPRSRSRGGKHPEGRDGRVNHRLVASVTPPARQTQSSIVESEYVRA